MECECGLRAVQFGYCVICWLQLQNYMYYFKHMLHRAESEPPESP